ncbi:transposase, partial [Leisingera daeponensis]|uniref:transposase n=1 Tax=Leisingera daeponensis TaxID=405746 RepID=UPI0021BCFDA5
NEIRNEFVAHIAKRTPHYELCKISQHRIGATTWGADAGYRESGLARRLMTVPGVGPVVALSFIATLDNAERFRRSRDVGAFLGLTPRRHQSGDMDWSGRISKCGDRDLRRLLYSAATTLITQVRKPSQLRAWAKRLQDRKGFKKAAVAASRKLAVVMMCIWRDQTVFEPGKELIT